jgi:predicted DNA-binding transcriptional regulator YafY
MPVNRNALIRYSTIDRCLRNRYRRWSLEDLMNAVSDALYEYEGIDKGVSRRTIQLDIQTMRSEKIGYNAPIIVIDRKFYTYEDPSYSITKLPLSENDLNKLNDALEILKQFQAFSHFQDMSGLVRKIENKIYIEQTRKRPIIHIDKNDNLKGLEHLNGLYQAVLHKTVIQLEYQSYKASNPQRLYYHPYLLKEYNNRWFLIGRKSNNPAILNLALDRIHKFKYEPDMLFIDNPGFDPDNYYKDIIGVTMNENVLPRTIIFQVSRSNAPYVITKPFHPSQQIISNEEKGVTFSIKVVPNFELERLFLGFGSELEILSPPSLRRRIASILKKSSEKYDI